MLLQITSAGLWSQNGFDGNVMNVPNKEIDAKSLEDANVNEDEWTSLAAQFWLNYISSGARRGKSALKFWKSDNELFNSQPETTSSESPKSPVNDAVPKTNKDESTSSRFPVFAVESLKAAIVRIIRKWHGRLSFFWRHAKRILGSLWVSR